MGLSPTLLDYAENIWRRFPEAFISLGLPHLEEMFVLNEGNWSCRVIDTKWSKIVEIVLPRRGEDQPELDEVSCAEGDEVEDEDPPGDNAPPLASTTPPSRAMAQPSAVADPSKEYVSLRLGQLDKEVGKLLGTITDRVSQEVEVQLQRELWSRTMQERLQSTHNCAARGQSPTALSQPESSGSAASSLAARRGVSLSPFDTGSLRRWPPGGESVTRVPHLDRTDSRASSRGEGLSASPSPPSEANSRFGTTSVLRTQEENSSDSPGTQIQRRAERRRRLGAVATENEGLDTMPGGPASMPSGASHASSGSMLGRSALPGRGALPSGGLPAGFDSDYPCGRGDFRNSLSYMHNDWETGYGPQSDSLGAVATQNNSVGFEIDGGDDIYDHGDAEQEECHSPVKGRGGARRSRPGGLLLE